ncbi:hypothetical protein [Enterobacter mori]|uniref:hypothetical protein n=1 Tax=Enterobacter mori TaxID=539813 RepID=UPI002DBC4DAD|nr:hypothetical protein [Enterobacter mori]MEB7916246.1 hypothetical protein [Enterobacter mori]
MVTAFNGLSEKAQQLWLWWNLSLPEQRLITFNDVIDDEPVGVKWDSPEKTRLLLAMTTPANLNKVKTAMKSEQRIVGGLYKRTRVDDNGIKAQRVEVRFDGIAGFLRTPAGGYSRQSILVVEIRFAHVSSPRGKRLA